MLEFLRRGVSSFVVKILLGLLVVSFAIWGVEDMFLNTGTGAVASVDGDDVKTAEFAREFERSLRRLQQQTGGQIGQTEARAMGLDRQIVNQMALSKLFEVEANRLSLAAPDAEIAKTIRDTDAFKDELGRFDRFQFDSLLRQNGYSEEEYIDITRSDMKRDQLIRAVGLGVRAPKVLAARIFQHRAEQRLADYVVLTEADLKQKPKADDASLRAFHQENAALFTAPEYRSLSYLHVTADAIAETVDVSEEELAAEYDARADDYIEAERRDIAQLLFPDAASANQALSRARAGESLIALGKDLLDLTEEDILFTEIRQGSLAPEVDAIAFDLSQGAVSDPIETAFGVALVSPIKVTPAVSRSLEDVKDELRTAVAIERANDALFEIVNRIEDERAGGSTLREAASNAGYQVRRADAVDRSGNGLTGEPVAGLPNDTDFLAAAFDLVEGGESELLELDDGSYAIISLERITPSALRPFEQVKAQVAAAWMEGEITRLLSEKAMALADQVNGGGNLEDVAGKARLKVQSLEGPIMRAGPKAPFATDTGLRLFEAREGEAITGPAEDGGQVVAVTTRVIKATSRDAQAVYDNLRSQLSQVVTQDVLGQYQQALQSEYNVEIYPGAIDRLFAADEQ